MATDAPNHATNQRVSNALLGQKLDHLATTNKEGFASVNERLGNIEDRQAATDISNATSAQWRDQHDKDHDIQRKNSRTETIVASIVAALAGAGISVKIPWQGP